jgi:hypothetical protein
MRSALVHAVLLGVALLAAFATWTWEGAEASGEPVVLVWEREPAEVAGVTFVAGQRRVELERRSEGDQRWLWGRETFPTPVPMIPPGDSAAPAPPTPPLTVEEYPLDVAGETLFERLAALTAVRDLGPADDEKRTTYGLGGTEPALTVHFTDGSERTLVFGGSVAGGGPRYLLDADSQHVYVVPPDVIIPFEGGVGTLRLNAYQGFPPDDVTTATVRAGTVERTMQRKMVDSPPRAVWTPTDSETPDVAFGNFMQQLDGLWVERYDPGVPAISLQSLLRAEYTDWRGGALGYLELFRAQAADGSTRYYMRTPKTIVVGQINTPQGERIEQDIMSLFRPGPAGPQG